jgi:hypothetical protein
VSLHAEGSAALFSGDQGRTRDAVAKHVCVWSRFRLGHASPLHVPWALRCPATTAHGGGCRRPVALLIDGGESLSPVKACRERWVGV